MTDKFPKAVRSKIMANIRGKDTKPEIALRGELFSRGRRYGLHKRIESTRISPDIYFHSKRLCIFVDGCFWHGCDCSKLPKSNKSYWIPKIRGNIERDKKQNSTLMEMGYNVLRVWEHDILKDLRGVVDNIERFLSE